MSDLHHRLTDLLEPLLSLRDPRERISAYHDMPYALFRYDAEDELEVRKEVNLLATRLSQKGKRVTQISLMDCLQEGVYSERPLNDWVAAERELGPEAVIDTVHAILSDSVPITDLVAKRLPQQSDPLHDVVFIVRTGSLFPFYRTFSLLEQLKGRISVPTILFYPGDLDGTTGLKFMGVMEAEHNYRPKIF